MAGLMKLLDPVIAPVAKLYRSQLAKDLNKMGKLDNYLEVLKCWKSSAFVARLLSLAKMEV